MTQDTPNGLKGQLKGPRTCFVQETPHLGQKEPKNNPKQDLQETTPSSELDTSKWCQKMV